MGGEGEGEGDRGCGALKTVATETEFSFPFSEGLLSYTYLGYSQHGLTEEGVALTTFLT